MKNQNKKTLKTATEEDRRDTMGYDGHHGHDGISTMGHHLLRDLSTGAREAKIKKPSRVIASKRTMSLELD